MGDINLLARINKLADKFKNAITTSDKASKSKFGIVKVGNGIDVSSGVISVTPVIPPGLTFEKIFEKTTSTSVGTKVTLEKPYNDYKILVFIGSNNTSGQHRCFGIGVPSEFTHDSSSDNYVYLSSIPGFSVREVVEDSEINYSKLELRANNAILWLKVYGLK